MSTTGHLPRLILLWSGLLILGGYATAGAATAPGIECSGIPDVMARLHSRHISDLARDRAFAQRVAGLFVKALDSQKTVFLAADAQRIEAQMVDFVLGMNGTDCGFLIQVLDQQKRGYGALYEAALKEAEQPDLEVDRTVEVSTDADKRPWPKDAQAQTALRHKLFHLQLANWIASKEPMAEAKKKLAKRYKLLKKRIDEQNKTDIYNLYLEAYASAFDPHTSYFSNEALEDFRIGMNLSLEGIGATLQQKDGYTVVAELVPGGAADRQGQLKRKDKIIAVAQGEGGEAVDVVDMSLRDVVRLIRGAKGTQVRLTVLRQEGTTRTFPVLITRDKIDLKEQAARLSWQTVERKGKPVKLAVLELPSFYGGVSSDRQSNTDVRDLLREAKKGKAQGLVFDLSRNAGGLLDHAVDIAGYFIRAGGVVAVDGVDSQVLEDEDPSVEYAGPLVVLTSRSSASASEIVAGALKDYRRAVLVGDERSYGKGTVQNITPLAQPRGAVKFTVARFYRPGGESTQGRGVEVDIRLPSLSDRSEFSESELPYSIPQATRAPFVSDKANGRGAARYTPVEAAAIQRLAKASAARVERDEKFKEIKEKLEKFEKNKHTLRVAEILAEGKGEDDEEEDSEEEAIRKGKKLSPQAKEALEILADLVVGP